VQGIGKEFANDAKDAKDLEDTKEGSKGLGQEAKKRLMIQGGWRGRRSNKKLLAESLAMYLGQLGSIF